MPNGCLLLHWMDSYTCFHQLGFLSNSQEEIQITLWFKLVLFMIALDLQSIVHRLRWKEKLATLLVNTPLFQQFDLVLHYSLCWFLLQDQSVGLKAILVHVLSMLSS